MCLVHVLDFVQAKWKVGKTVQNFNKALEFFKFNPWKILEDYCDTKTQNYYFLYTKWLPIYLLTELGSTLPMIFFG